MFVINLPQVRIIGPTIHEPRFRLETMLLERVFSGRLVDPEFVEAEIDLLFEGLKNDAIEGAKKMLGVRETVQRPGKPNILPAELQAKAPPEGENSTNGLGGGIDFSPREGSSGRPFPNPKRSNRKID